MEKIWAHILKYFPDIPLPANDTKNLPWEDYFFLFFLNVIEPKLQEIPLLIIYDFPAQLAALSKLCPDNLNFCERFELYIYGVEIGNCYNELTDLSENKKRFKEQSEIREKCYNYKVSEPNELYDALEKGLPKCSGMAIGVERLVKMLSGESEIFFS